MEVQREQGIVKNIIKEKFGFIATPSGEDRFFHWSGMSANSFKPFHHLHVGDTVTFLPATGKNGELQAVEIEAVIKTKKKNVD